MTTVLVVLAAVTLFALTAVGALWAGQERLLFPFRHGGTPVAAEGGWLVGRVEVPGAGPIAFLHAEGDADASRPVVLFLHGNGSSARWTAGIMAPVVRAGFPVVAAEYPGYSGNPGAPTEASLRATAEATAAWARARWPGRPLAVIGESIGSAPAVHLAVTGVADRLVLDSGFTSVTEAIRHHLPWLPGAARLNRHPMDNLGAIRAAAAALPPTLVLLSAEDRVVPTTMGERIAAAVPGSVTYRSARPGHPVLHTDPAATAALLTWLGADDRDGRHPG